MHGDPVKRWRRPGHQCEHLNDRNATGRLEQCDDDAYWRVSSAIKVIIGNYCDQHLPKIWPGWRKERI